MGTRPGSVSVAAGSGGRLPVSRSRTFGAPATVQRVLLAGSVLYVVGLLIRFGWLSGHPGFGTRGYGELWVHAPLWSGVAVVASAAGWAIAARAPGRGYRSVFGAALGNLGAEGWHTWAHYHHHD